MSWPIVNQYLALKYFLPLPVVVVLIVIVARIVDCRGCCHCPLHKVISRIPSKCIRKFCLNKLSSCSSCTSKEKTQSCGSKLFLSLGRFLCLQMYPGLFTKHKIRRAPARRRRRRRKTPAQDSMEVSSEVFLVLLNRKVKDDSNVVPAFSLMSLLIFVASVVAFTTYVPLVTTGVDCREKDSNGRTLFCYTNESVHPLNCSNHSGSKVTCYAWTSDVFAVAFAVALAMFKPAIVITTVYTQIVEWCLNVKANKCRKLKLNTSILKWVIYIVLSAFSIVYFGIYVVDIYVRFNGTADEVNNSVLAVILNALDKYAVYIFLMFAVCLGLVFITTTLPAHCEQMEYNTLSPDQEPSVPCPSPGELPAPNTLKQGR